MGTRSSHLTNDGLKVSKISLIAQEILYQEGEPAECLYLIEAGTVEVFQRSGSRTVSLERLGAGEVVGELALIEGATHTRGARALTDISLLRVSASQVHSVLDESHALTRMLLKHVVRKLDRTNDIAFGQPDSVKRPAGLQPLGEVLG